MAEGVSAHFAEDGAAAVAAARHVALDVGAGHVGPQHLAAGALRNADDETLLMLSRYGITADAVRRRLIPARPDDPAVAAPSFDPKAKAALRLAHMLSSSRENRIACVHLLQALFAMREPSLLAFLRDRAEVDQLVAGLTAHADHTG